MVNRSGLAILVVSLCSSGDLVAADETEEAKTRFAKARRYFEAEEFEAALPHFRAAAELSGRRPSVVFGLAQCLRALKLYQEAIDNFEEYLATNPGDAEDVRKTIQLLKEIEADRKKQHPPDQPAEPPPETGDPEPGAAPRSSPDPKPSPKPEPDVTPLTLETQAPAEDSILSSPLLWVVAGVVVVGSAIAIGVAASSGADPYSGSTDVLLRY